MCTVYGRNGIGWELDLLTLVDAQVHVAKEATAEIQGIVPSLRGVETLSATLTHTREVFDIKRHINTWPKNVQPLLLVIFQKEHYRLSCISDRAQRITFHKDRLSILRYSILFAARYISQQSFQKKRDV